MALRYLLDFKFDNMEKSFWDVIVMGSGIAGLYAALNLDPALKVCLVTKGKTHENNSYLAQGGIAAAVEENDLPQHHFEDTIKAGAGHCNQKAVKILTEEGPKDIEALCNIGTNFDKNQDGTLRTTREGGHGCFRVVHALGDSTGKEVVDSLIRECKKRKNIKIFENHFAVDFLTEAGRCIGIISMHERNTIAFLAKAVICASGGMGQVYGRTTNPEAATGDGIAMAYRAGAVLKDMEFVQFHPTVFYNSSFLISEAVRGEGGILRNIQGRRFMTDYHEMAEIAPRDIVSRAILSEMKKTDSECVFLDITHRQPKYLRNRFPTIYKRCMEAGIDITRDYIPVYPAHHYFMGGIETDLWGRTNIKRLYVCGEAACTGVHGANRLASNSLLEGLVFGRRCAEDINRQICKFDIESPEVNYSLNRAKSYIDVDKIQGDIKEAMDDYAGIERNGEDMKKVADLIDSIIKKLETASFNTKKEMETINIAYVAHLILKGAVNRKHSLGSHYRTDENILDKEDGLYVKL